MTDIVKVAPRRWLITVPDQIVSGIASQMMSAASSSLWHWRFTDEQKYFVSEASVYRLLKAHDLITSPAYVAIKAANEFKDKTTAINQLWQTDFTYLKDHRLGMVLSLNRARRLLALHRGLEAVCHHVRTVPLLRRLGFHPGISSQRRPWSLPNGR